MAGDNHVRNARPRAWIALTIGTALSIALAFVASVVAMPEAPTGHQSQIMFGVLVGLLSESLGVMVALWARVSEAQNDLSELLNDASAIMQLSSRVASADEPIMTERYQQLLLDMKELAEGRYELKSLEAVYDDDQRSIGYLHRDESLRSICPLSHDRDELERQLTNRSFIASSEAHLEAQRRGVNVTRIFIFVRQDHFELEIVANQMKMMAEAGVDVRYIFRDSPAYREVLTIDPDFVVFGEHKVSVGTIDPGTGMVDGAHVRTDLEAVRKYIRNFEQLRRISESFRSTTAGR